MRSADDRTAIARIRDAAIEQFGQHGFGVGLRTIADAAGVSAALVIHHFGSKEALYGEVFERNLGRASIIGMDRGLNDQWTRGGLIYGMPTR